VIPATCNFESPNPLLMLDDSPFFVNSKASQWTTPNGELRSAGINNFGMGGTNAHLIVQEHVTQAPSDAHVDMRSATPQPLVFCISAKTPQALRQMRENFRELMDRMPIHTMDRRHKDWRSFNEELVDSCWTLQMGRQAFCCREAIVCSTWQELAMKINGQLDAYHSSIANPIDALAFVLAPWDSAGVEHIALCAEAFSHAHEPFHQLYDTCNEVVATQLSMTSSSYRQALAASDCTPELRLAQRLVVQYCVAKVWLELLSPAAFVVEASDIILAACLSGCVDFKTAAELLLSRTLPKRLSIPASVRVSAAAHDIYVRRGDGGCRDGLVWKATDSTKLLECFLKFQSKPGQWLWGLELTALDQANRSMGFLVSDLPAPESAQDLLRSGIEDAMCYMMPERIHTHDVKSAGSLMRRHMCSTVAELWARHRMCAG